METIEVAVYDGKILCGFGTREECKSYIRDAHPDIDPFDVELKTLYISGLKSYSGPIPR